MTTKFVSDSNIKCEKSSVTSGRAVVVTNHPLASAAGTQVLSSGGNAVDAAIASLFALTVVEPMMVGVLGGGLIHLRDPSGQHIIIDGLSTAPNNAAANMFTPLRDGLPSEREVVGDLNSLGAKAFAVPGALMAWCHALKVYGSLTLHDVLLPAISLAEHGFLVTPYLSTCISENADRISQDKELEALFLPGSQPLIPGSRLRRADYAATLRAIAAEGAEIVYNGEIGDRIVNNLSTRGGIISSFDLKNYSVIERNPISSEYRGFEIFGPPPPASSGVHISQMLNILEGYDMASLGFGSPESLHLTAEAMKIAFADRQVSTADPDFVSVPVERLISKEYAKHRRKKLNSEKALNWLPEAHFNGESNETTHVTVADEKGYVVSATQTINGLFGACLSVPGTGLIANNYMLNFDPHPDRVLSVAPGKRVFTSMAPMIVEQNGHAVAALGLPGALRIFPSAFQAILNLIDYEMDLQSAVEAPRIWTEGGVLEVEDGFSSDICKALVSLGHEVSRVPRIAGGMNAIKFNPDGSITGSACWRADGVPIGLGGGLARAGVGFSVN